MGGSVVREGQTSRLAGSAERTKDSQKEFRDRAYHKMILDLLRPHCSERSKMFHSFFTRKDNGSIDIGCKNHLEKCRKIFDTIFNINHTTEKQNNDMAREKAFQETQIFLDEAVRIQESRKQVINSSCDTINQVFSGNKVHEMLSNHVIFRTCYLQTSDIFLIVQSICSQTLTSLSALLRQYEDELNTLNCTKKPAFLSICQEILAQPYYDPGSNFDSYDDGLTIEEKLAKLSIHEEGSTKASAEEDAEEKIDQKAGGSSKTKTGGKKKGKKKKKKKSAPAAACEHDEESSDDEEAESSANDIQTGLSATVPTALEPSLSETTLSSSSVVYLEPTAGASRGTNKVLPDAIKQPYQHGKGKKSAAVKAEATNQPSRAHSTEEEVVPTASTPIAPWMIDLMRAHEYNFKATIRTVYHGLTDMGLRPNFITRNEKFVLGFISPLTGQPFAITEDVPHGSQDRKGQAAGWIKKIKHSLREHGVIPTGY